MTVDRVLQINRKVPAQFLADLLTSAVEGVATGQWLSVSSIIRAEKQPTAICEYTDHLSVCRLLEPRDREAGGARFDPKDFQPGFDSQAEWVSLGMMHRGLQRLYERNPEGNEWLVLPNRNDLRGRFLSIDAADYDSIDADIILQLALFGDVVYG